MGCRRLGHRLSPDAGLQPRLGRPGLGDDLVPVGPSERDDAAELVDRPQRLGNRHARTAAVARPARPIER